MILEIDRVCEAWREGDQTHLAIPIHTADLPIETIAEVYWRLRRLGAVWIPKRGVAR